jgi:hypothetical protein|tara:strand:- start:541 stop:1203 length:663 start_codon:yes stop_codon:yes gene_type:complete
MSRYFRNLPNFEYISRINERKTNKDFITVKNLFRRPVIREDLFTDFMSFTKYQIVGDERPDEVAYKIYGDSTLDWIVLLSNNIVNVRDEWPLTQQDYRNYLIEKYGNDTNALDVIKFYETEEIKDSEGKVFVPKKMKVDSTYKVSFLDSGTNKIVEVSPIQGITYRTYEDRLQEDKRNINLLKSEYVSIVLDDIETLLDYEQSTEYINPVLKRASNPNLG